MTKKHFIQLAETLAQVIAAMLKSNAGQTTVNAINALVTGIVSFCEAFNPRFEELRFIRHIVETLKGHNVHVLHNSITLGDILPIVYTPDEVRNVDTAVPIASEYYGAWGYVTDYNRAEYTLDTPIVSVLDVAAAKGIAFLMLEVTKDGFTFHPVEVKPPIRKGAYNGVGKFSFKVDEFLYNQEPDETVSTDYGESLSLIIGPFHESEGYDELNTSEKAYVDRYPAFLVHERADGIVQVSSVDSDEEPAEAFEKEVDALQLGQYSLHVGNVGQVGVYATEERARQAMREYVDKIRNGTAGRAELPVVIMHDGEVEQEEPDDGEPDE